ncbi:glycosyltransferase family 4 protein [Humisphaera borealis]|uniref:Glycosyltransferase family 4 protein n=1 Tax=Humisphaera borealis TaxID=2807512 RepID=A0A7M2WZL1_9BACT|nr:glycosyltransferase family 4 protein [Humisphaera borealis]
MRVLIATRHLSIVGGVETYLRAVLPRLRDYGFDLAVLAEHGEPSGGVVSGVPGVPVWLAGAGAIAEVERWVPDVVYAHGLGDPNLEAALADRFPTVLYAHNYQGTCVSGTKCQTRPEFAPCARVLGPGCLAAYLPRGCGGRNPVTMLSLYRSQRRSRSNLGRYRAVLVASAHMAAEFRRHGAPEDRLRLVPLFPPDAVPDPKPPESRQRSDRVLFVGRVTVQKGLRHLIEAVPIASARIGRPLTLVVAGDGPDRGAAESEAKRHGVPVEFLGWVDSARRTGEMRGADVLLVPSVWPEPFGLVGVEAGCVGLPAVGYATGGIPDWLSPGVSGESAPGERPDPKELAAALVRALSSEKHLQRLRVGAREMAARFTPEAHLAQLIDVFHAVSHAGRLAATGAK